MGQNSVRLFSHRNKSFSKVVDNKKLVSILSFMKVNNKEVKYDC